MPNKLDNLGEMDKLLQDTNYHNCLKKEKKSRPVISKDIEFVIKKLPMKNIPHLHDFTGKFHETFKENINTNPSQTLPKIRRGRNTS